MKVYAGELIGRVLKQEGITRVFGLCGGHNASMLKALADNGIEFVGTHHEESAINMAEAWARATHHLGVALVTAGPGLANAIPGMVTAHKAKSPVFVISGRSSDMMEDMEDAQELDQLALVKPITKWAQTVHCPARIPEMVATGVRMALSGRPGVTFLDIPKNIAVEEAYMIEEDAVPQVINYRTETVPYGDPAKIKEIVDTLLAAQRPIILTGTGVVYADAGKELNSFCEKSGVPCITWKYSRGIVADDKPYAASVYALTQTDAVLVLGTQLDWSLGFGRAPMIPANAKIMQIDIDASEIGHNRSVDIGVVADAKAALEQMLDCLADGKPAKMDCWPPEFDSPAAKAHIAAVGMLPKESIDLVDLCVTLGRKLPKDAIFVADGGETSIYAMWYMHAYENLGVNITPTLGMLGVGLPNAIALKMAFPEREVVLLSGDGAFGFTAMEMNTALRYNVPVKVVVANDSAWGNIQNFFNRIYGYPDGNGTVLNETRYDGMVAGLGGEGEMVTKFSELSDALDRLMASDKPSLLNVRIDNSISMERKMGATPFPMQ